MLEPPLTNEPTGSMLPEFGSPSLSIDRTFRVVFQMAPSKRRRALTQVAKRQYRNPIHLAQEWQSALDSGDFSSCADLAHKLGVSRARVTQILRLLRLDPEVVKMVAGLGDPLTSRTVTERVLRPIVSLPPEEQIRTVRCIFGKTR
jgi:hypothetical protein